MAANEEKTENISVTLPLEVWGVLALQADGRDMTLNDYLLDIVMAEVVETKGITMTSDEWLKYHPVLKGRVVTDPDGWDRKNFEASWAESITRKEFERRVMLSTSLADFD